jgi:hypothetical protein
MHSKPHSEPMSCCHPVACCRRQTTGVVTQMVLIIFLVGWSFILSIPSTRAEGGSIFRGMNPEHVFQISILPNQGADYRQFTYVSDKLGACDLSRPPQVRECHVDLFTLARQFRHVDIVKSVPSVPASIRWEAWDWETMSMKPDGYTPIMLAAEIKEWDAENNRGHQWWLACSMLPDNPQLAVCQETDFIDDRQPHAIVRIDLTFEIRYTIVRADRLLTIRQSFAGDVASDPTEEGSDGLGAIMDGIYS